MNRLYYGDNLDILRNHLDDESVNLIYIDPPFNSNRNYNMIWDEASAQVEAFKDTWSLRSIADEEALIFEKEPQRYSSLHDALTAFKILLIHGDKSLYAYLVNIGIRLVEMHRVLKKTGSFYLHCDHRASHYLKALLDAIFGSKNFRNEIIWHYGGRGAKAVAKQFPRNHDVIFFYSKNSSKHQFTRQYLDRLFTEQEARKKGYRQDNEGRWFKTAPRGDYTDASIKRLEAEGRIYHTKTGNIRIKYFLEVKNGLVNDTLMVSDTWSDIPDAMHMGNEYLGYPTQKHSKLLKRIIAASSKEGDLVLDAYCGCGTTVAAAQRLGRRWIGIDITYIAVELIKHRLVDRYYLEKCGGDFKEASRSFNDEVEVFGIPKDFEGAKALATQTKGDRVRKEFEKWAVFTFGGIFFEKKGADGGIDGYFYIVDADKNGKADTRVKAYIQVKSGKVDVSHIRDFSHVLEREEAPLGVFITMKPPTKPMLDEVAQMPKYKNKLTRLEYDRIHLITVDDILEGNLPTLPMTRATKQAPANRDDTETEDFLS